MKQEKEHFYFFEWIRLFILLLIPVAMVVHTVIENNREYAIAFDNRAQDLEIADNQQRKIVLHEYQKTLGDLLEKYGPYLNESVSASLVARFATLSALNHLDPDQRSFLIRLLYDAKLITYHSVSDQPVVSLESANLTGLCLIDGSVGQTFTHISMKGAIMTRANFYGINIHGAIFNRTILNNADFSNTTNVWLCDSTNCVAPNNPSIYFDNADLTFASFSGAIYTDVTFKSAKMINVNLKSFKCEFCEFTTANMIRGDLQKSEFEKSSFMFVTLIKANLHQSMFFRNAEFYGADMSQINATYSNFTQCQLISTQLKNAVFDYAVVMYTTFMKSHLYRISMQHSILIEVNFTDANLTEGNWRHIRCERCIFTGTNFTNADLFNGIFIECDFRNSTITKEQLKQAASLKNSLFPDGIVTN